MTTGLSRCAGALKRKGLAATALFAAACVFVFCSRSAHGFNPELRYPESTTLVEALIGGSEFRAKVGLLGKGVRVAIVDTGVDVSHAALSGSPDGRAKVVDWADFTDEGKVKLAPGQVQVPRGFVSVSGRYTVGLLREADLDASAPFRGDLNGDGNASAEYLVVAADSKSAGKYDLVVVDQDGDGDLLDERPMGTFKSSRSYGRFGRRSSGVAFVVADLDPEGGWVKIGFDGNGHGTQVAGVVAGYGGSASFSGVAPAAEVVAVKALRSSGEGGWEQIARALEYAVGAGADVVCLSTAGPSGASSSKGPESRLLEALGRSSGALFVVAAGNGGPGLRSGAAPGGDAHTIAVGGYVPTGRGDGGEVWDWSGAGPRADGGLLPNVVAPVKALSCAPLWLDPGGYVAFSGTSVSAAYVAGVAALLIEELRSSAPGSGDVASTVRRAVEAGARPLGDALWLEQGYGAVDLMASWESLRRLASSRGSWELDPVTRVRDGYQRGGVFAEAPGKLVQYLSNYSAETVTLKLQEAPSWLGVNRRAIALPPVSQRPILLEDQGLPGEGGGGVKSGLVRWDDPATPATDLDICTTFVAPVALDPLDGWTAGFEGSVGRGEKRRHFVKVAGHAQRLTASLLLEMSEDGAPHLYPAITLSLFDPGGNLAAWSSSDGWGETEAEGGSLPGANVSAETPRVDATVSLSVESVAPAPGMWEVVVHAPLSSWEFRDPETPEQQSSGHVRYRLTVKVSGIFPVEVRGDDADLYDGALRLVVRPGVRSRDVTARVKLANASEAFVGRVAGVGLHAVPPGTAWEDEVARMIRGFEEDLYVEGNRGTARYLPEIPPKTRWLVVRGTMVAGQQGALCLHLYRYDPLRSDWILVSSSAGAEQVEEIHVFLPEPGQYMVYVEPYWAFGGKAKLKLRCMTLTDEDAILVHDAAYLHPSGSTWELEVRATLPRSSGRYAGFLVVEDIERWRILELIPLVVDVGMPELVASVTPPVLAAGRATPVRIAVMERSTLQPVKGSIMMNGKDYALVDGSVEVFLLPKNAGYVELALSLDDAEHAFMARTFRLPVVTPGDSGAYAAATSSPGDSFTEKKLDELLSQIHKGIWPRESK